MSSEYDLHAELADFLEDGEAPPAHLEPEVLLTFSLEEEEEEEEDRPSCSGACRKTLLQYRESETSITLEGLREAAAKLKIFESGRSKKRYSELQLSQFFNLYRKVMGKFLNEVDLGTLLELHAELGGKSAEKRLFATTKDFVIKKYYVLLKGLAFQDPERFLLFCATYFGIRGKYV